MRGGGCDGLEVCVYVWCVCGVKHMCTSQAHVVRMYGYPCGADLFDWNKSDIRVCVHTHLYLFHFAGPPIAMYIKARMEWANTHILFFTQQLPRQGGNGTSSLPTTLPWPSDRGLSPCPDGLFCERGCPVSQC